MTNTIKSDDGLILNMGTSGYVIDAGPTLHPATQSLLRYFEYAHLPEDLQWVSQPFHDLAHDLAHNFELSGAELTAGLRKLLEAKDCAVRAAVS